MARSRKPTPAPAAPPAQPARSGGASRAKSGRASQPPSTGDETLDALKLWWSENGKYLVVSAVIGLAAVGGWRAWEYNHQMTMREASGLYAELLERIEDVEPAESSPDDDADADAEEDVNEDASAPPESAARADAAEELFADLRADFANTPYPVLAALAMARLRVETGDLAAAADHLRWAADHSDQQEFKALALVRLMRVLLEMGKAEEASDVLIDNDFPRGFDAVAGEINGDVLSTQQRFGEAVAAYREALSKLSDRQGFIEMKLQDMGASASEEDAAPTAPRAPAEVPADTGVPNIMQ